MANQLYGLLTSSLNNAQYSLTARAGLTFPLVRRGGMVCLHGGITRRKKSQKWDEMNILATYHPADKDYGLMKIDEPSTPYNRMVGDEEDDGALSDSDVNAPTVDDLASRLAAAEGTEPRFMREEEEEEEEESSEEEEELTPEDQAKKKQFQMMRKMHYNEGLNIRMARQLIANELAEEEDEDEEMRDDTETEDISVDPPQDALDS
ncbi:protein phosphatase inhibitor 2 isoform X2 [Esox lucius]|nr:protein phosphatase inhibitor 2 isoform X2 [Esox lucius]